MWLVGSLAYLFFFYPIWSTYFPVGDDIAFLANSRFEYWREWGSLGFSEYFRTYPEWAAHASDFLRPVVNFYWAVVYSIAGDNWAVYMASIYVWHSGVCVLATGFFSRQLQLKTSTAIILLMALLVSPSFVGPGIAAFSVSYGFAMLLATALTILLIINCLNRNLALVLIIGTTLVLTKEFGLAVCTTLAVAHWFLQSDSNLNQRLGLTMALISPIILYGIWRYCIFGTETNLYVFGATDLITQTISNAIAVPINALHTSPKWALWSLSQLSNRSPSQFDLVFALTIFANLMFWSMSAYFAWKLLHQSDRYPQALVLLGLLIGGLAGYFVLVGPQSRLIYGLVALSIVAVAWGVQDSERIGRNLSRIVLGCYFIIAVHSLYISLDSSNVHLNSDRSNRMAQLVETIQAADSPARIWLANSMAGFSSTTALMRLANTDAEIIETNAWWSHRKIGHANSVGEWPAGHLRNRGGEVILSAGSDSQVLLKSTPPEGLFHIFFLASPKLIEMLDARHFARRGIIYELPSHMDIPKPRIDGPLQMTIPLAADDVLIYFDGNLDRYCLWRRVGQQSCDTTNSEEINP